MKAPLSNTLIRDLKFNEKPSLKLHKQSGQARLDLVATVPNKLPYIILDGSPDAPTGFGVKVGKRGKVFIIRRRIPGQSVVKYNVGMVNDFNGLESAYVAAQRLLSTLLLGHDPRIRTKSERVGVHKDLTVGEAFVLYSEYLKTRGKAPAKESTLKGLDAALHRFGRDEIALINVKLKDISILMAEDVFYKLKTTKRFAYLGGGIKGNKMKAFDKSKRSKNSESWQTDDPKYWCITTAEQTFRWAARVVKYVRKLDLLNASQERRSEHFPINAFAYVSEDRSRGMIELESAYKINSVRNPMSAKISKDQSRSTLGRFLDVLIGRRLAPYYRVEGLRFNPARTGCDYILLSLLCGGRKSEAAKLLWGDLITAKQRETHSHVDLDKMVLVFRDTKNRMDHELPMTNITKKILADRLIFRHEVKDSRRIWVFPQRNTTYRNDPMKTVSTLTTSHIADEIKMGGYYSSPQSLLTNIAKEAGLTVRTHDLRRTFGRIAEEETLSETLVKRMLNHRNDSSSTARYMEVEMDRLRDYLLTIQTRMILTSPSATRIFLDKSDWINCEVKIDESEVKVQDKLSI